MTFHFPLTKALIWKERFEFIKGMYIRIFKIPYIHKSLFSDFAVKKKLDDSYKVVNAFIWASDLGFVIYKSNSRTIKKDNLVVLRVGL